MGGFWRCIILLEGDAAYWAEIGGQIAEALTVRGCRMTYSVRTRKGEDWPAERQLSRVGISNEEIIESAPSKLLIDRQSYLMAEMCRPCKAIEPSRTEGHPARIAIFNTEHNFVQPLPGLQLLFEQLTVVYQL